MTVVLVTDPAGTITIFESEELARRSIEFSCHKLEGKVVYSLLDDGSTEALQPNGKACKYEVVHVFGRVTHL